MEGIPPAPVEKGRSGGERKEAAPLALPPLTLEEHYFSTFFVGGEETTSQPHKQEEGSSLLTGNPLLALFPSSSPQTFISRAQAQPKGGPQEMERQQGLVQGKGVDGRG